jgi:hypothetical protein
LGREGCGRVSAWRHLEDDATVKGIGARVTAAGARAFVLNYRIRSGRERRYTIGSFPDWTTASAREEASKLKKRIDQGEDPLAEIQAGRDAPTVADLCKRYIEEHLPKKRAHPAADDRGMITNNVLPAMGAIKVADIACFIDTSADVFGGDEISRTQVRQFVGLLRGIAIRQRLSVVLLAHPSLCAHSQIYEIKLRPQGKADAAALAERSVRSRRWHEG